MSGEAAGRYTGGTPRGTGREQEWQDGCRQYEENYHNRIDR